MISPPPAAPGVAEEVGREVRWGHRLRGHGRGRTLHLDGGLDHEVGEGRGRARGVIRGLGLEEADGGGSAGRHLEVKVKVDRGLGGQGARGAAEPMHKNGKTLDDRTRRIIGSWN